jgi:phosphotransferase system enzyme I (PtsI)
MADARKELVVKGIGVSPGVATGPAFLLTTDDVRVVERDISEDEIPREISRFEESLIATRRQIHEIQQRVGRMLDRESASIFDAHLLVVDDRAFVEEVIRSLRSMRKNVESVLRAVADRYVQALAGMEDDYLRERAADVRDVARRILHNLAGESRSSLAELDHRCVVVARDLSPSDTASMDREKVIAFVTDLGSPTSHTAIMARALEIPAAVGLHDASVRVSAGDPVLVDGAKGLLIVHPSDATLERYGRRERDLETIRGRLAELRDQPAQTLDGYNLSVAANIELPHDVDAVLRHGAEGIGLFRSEFLFLSREHAPQEAEQAAAYREVAERLAPQTVIVRTLDLGGDKFTSALKIPSEMNPFMGWRAIRFCLAQPEVFLTQLRAILRASAGRNVKIMYPMISNVDELVHANRILDQAKSELRREKAPFDEDIEVGCMIEVPSAALTANLLAPHVKFFSIGTNDLIQYTLAVDRVNERIAYLYEPTHPAILRLIQHTIDVSHESGIWTGICGEVAGDPILVPLLMGMGIDELSVSPNQVPAVKAVVRRLRYHQAEDLAREALGRRSHVEIQDLCRSVVAEAAPEILALTE